MLRGGTTRRQPDVWENNAGVDYLTVTHTAVTSCLSR